MENISLQNAEGRTFCEISGYKDVIHARWQGAVDDTMIKRACNEIVRAVDGTQYGKLLSDQKKAQYCPAIEGWVRTIWLPNLRYMGLQYLAMVHAPEVLTHRSYLAHDQKSVINDIVVQHFSVAEDAKQWFNLLEHVLTD